MSTDKIYLSDDEISEFIEETRDASQYFYGDEGEEYGVCPFITFYIYSHNHEKIGENPEEEDTDVEYLRNDDFLPLCDKVIELFQELQTLIDRPFWICFNSETQEWVHASPEEMSREVMSRHAKFHAAEGDLPFQIGATDQENPRVSARWAISACVTRVPQGLYTTVKITFRDSWYREGNNRQVWYAFIQKWIGRLQPEQCYSGYEIGTTTLTTLFFGAYEVDVLERICADYFYGLDIDHAEPQEMGSHNHEDEEIDETVLGTGLRPPTWSFLLSPLWRKKLGKSIKKIKADLSHPDIHITEIPYAKSPHNPKGEPALWIRLGELNLYPVDEGKPELPVIANKLIRPIRCDRLRLYTLDPFEGDVNPRFDDESGPGWMARFDKKGDWPNKEKYMPVMGPERSDTEELSWEEAFRALSMDPADLPSFELYMDEEEISDFIAETLDRQRDHEMYSYGYEGEEYGVCPFIVFYIHSHNYGVSGVDSDGDKLFYNDDFLPLCDEVNELYQELQTLIDAPFLKCLDNRTNEWVKATPKNMSRKEIRKQIELITDGVSDAEIGATDQENYGASARWAIRAKITNQPRMYYTTMKITFRDKWYRENRQVWQDFVHKWIRRLQPEHCYSGYEIGTTAGYFGTYESDITERICADYFYGLDVDHPWNMSAHSHDKENGYAENACLGAGLRTPTWSFLLSPLWRNKLGKSVEEVKAALSHPDIHITEIPYAKNPHNPMGEHALWIRAGELCLYPVSEGVPELPAIVNKLIRPIRCEWLKLYVNETWEGDPDPNPLWSDSIIPKWLARFDEDSEWTKEKYIPIKRMEETKEESSSTDERIEETKEESSSTDERFMSPEDISMFISKTQADDSITAFGDDRGKYGVCPFITFYIYGGNHLPHAENAEDKESYDKDFRPLCREIIELHQELQTLIDMPFLWCYNSKTQDDVKATPKTLGRKLLLEHAEYAANYGFKPFSIQASSEDDGGPDRWAIRADVTDNPWMCYTTVKIAFRDKWYRTGNNRQIWHDFVQKWIGRLQPEQCYSGYEIQTMGHFGTSESDSMNRICADYFYGLDVDHAGEMAYHNHDDEDGYINYAHLGAGLRTPTWCFMLSPLWRNKLGKSVEEIKAELCRPDIHITEIPYAKSRNNPRGEPALWIQLGELSLHPVSEGVPEALKIANKLIRPVRCNLLRLYSIEPWEEDPNPLFDNENSPKWMARFDEDSDWPE